jgi:hypothetical protein
MIGRRSFLKAAVAASAGRFLPLSSQAAAAASDALLARIDHIVYATPDLDREVDRLANTLGVRATTGGQHLGRGSRNALISLGPTYYLEILAPDPAQPPPEKSHWAGFDTLRAPKIVTWVANATDLEKLSAEAAQQGIKLGKVNPGGRKRPDGVVLTWKLTDLSTAVADRIVPGFIDWGETPHPARSSAQGARLVDFRAEHPNPEPVQKMLKQLGIDLPVQTGPQPALIATIIGPKGQIELR